MSSRRLVDQAHKFYACGFSKDESLERAMARVSVSPSALALARKIWELI